MKTTSFSPWACLLRFPSYSFVSSSHKCEQSWKQLCLTFLSIFRASHVTERVTGQSWKHLLPAVTRQVDGIFHVFHCASGHFDHSRTFLTLCQNLNSIMPNCSFFTLHIHTWKHIMIKKHKIMSPVNMHLFCWRMSIVSHCVLKAWTKMRTFK